MKKCNVLFLIIVLISIFKTNTYAYFSVTNADGKTIVYNNLVGNTVSVCSFHPKVEYKGNIVIPDSIIYNGKTYIVTTIESGAFSTSKELTSISIPNSVSSVGEYPFSNCVSLTSVTLNCNEVGPWFSDLKSIKEVIFGDKVTTIDKDAFYRCTSLNSVTFSNSLLSIGERAFYNTDLISVTIPNNVINIGNYAFSHCSRMVSAIIGSNVKNIGSSAFYGSNLKKIIWLTNSYSWVDLSKDCINYVSNKDFGFVNKIVYPFLSSYFETDGIIYVPVSPSDKTCDAIDCIYDNRTENIKIENTVTHKGVQMKVNNVNKYIFYENTNIKYAEINYQGPIVEHMFDGCTELTYAKTGNNVTNIGEYAFRNCSSLESIEIPNTVTAINEYVFSGCSKLKSIKIDNGLTSIKKYAFKDCINLPMIQIVKSITDIKDFAFSGCKGLKNVIIDYQETELNLGSNGSESLFADCLLDSVYIDRNIKYNSDKKYGYSPFYNNSTLRSVTITDKGKEISPYEFYGCTNLKNVSIGDSVEIIGDCAFSGCKSLEYFAFGRSVKTIGKEAFSDCTALTKLISRASTPPTCGTQALDDINKWNCTLSVPIGATTAYQQAPQWKDFFFIDNNVTGISKLTNSIAAPNHVYDLNGRKLKKPSKGINIIGGKKIMMK